MKKIISLHHWLGTFFSVLFLIWFLSGFVMMYQGFPYLYKKGKIAMLPNILDHKLQPPSKIFPNDTLTPIRKLTLNHQLNRPVFHLITNKGKFISKYADTGENVTINEAQALDIARENVGITEKASIDKITELDQWIPKGKFLKHMPIYKISFKDKAKTYTYVSSITGEILAKNTFSERAWSWVGAIPHWIYFRDIRVHSYFWYQLILWLSGLGFVMVITGVITGIVRFKRKTKKRFTRFKNKWYNFHYYFGLIFGTFICTWVFSGFMSMHPFDWTPSTQLSESEVLTWQKGDFNIAKFNNKTWNYFLAYKEGYPYQEIEFSLFDGEIFTYAHTKTTRYDSSISVGDYLPKTNTYRDIINSFSDTNKVIKTEILNEYDTYYYSRKNTKALPVIKFSTTNDITYYVNPITNKVVLKTSTNNKISRWLYNGLHSFDFSFLTSNRPLWDIVVIFLLLGGTVVCVTGTVMGYKFIKRKQKKRKKNKS